LPTAKLLMLIKLLAPNVTKVSTSIQPLNNAKLVILNAQPIPIIHPMNVQHVMLAMELLKEIVFSYKIPSPILPTQIIIQMVTI